jgi:hypothetical protein
VAPGALAEELAARPSEYVPWLPKVLELASLRLRGAP